MISVYQLGASGNNLFAGYGPGSSILKDEIATEPAFVGDGATWNVLQMKQNGKLFESGVANFSYDGQTITALTHIWINAEANIQVEDALIGQQFLAFVVTRAGSAMPEYHCLAGLVQGAAVSAYSDEMMPGDTLQIAVQSQSVTHPILGWIGFTASLLP